MAPKKSPIANLPASISCFKVKNTSGSVFWRVRVGKKFTGGAVILKNFATLGDAKKWIFGDAQSRKSKNLSENAQASLRTIRWIMAILIQASLVRGLIS